MSPQKKKYGYSILHCIFLINLHQPSCLVVYPRGVKGAIHPPLMTIIYLCILFYDSNNNCNYKCRSNSYLFDRDYIYATKIKNILLIHRDYTVLTPWSNILGKSNLQFNSWLRPEIRTKIYSALFPTPQFRFLYTKLYSPLLNI